MFVITIQEVIHFKMFRWVLYGRESLSPTLLMSLFYIVERQCVELFQELTSPDPVRNIAYCICTG